MSTFEPTAPESAAQSSIRPSQPVEIVPRGVLWSLAAIPLGMVVAVVLWRLGFIASISSFLIAAVGVFLYTKGAGTTPKRGIVPVGAVILVGVVASFFAIVAADLVEYYGTPQGQALGYPSAVQFVTSNLFNADLLTSYGTDPVMFVLCAALGVFGTMRRLLAARHA